VDVARAEATGGRADVIPRSVADDLHVPVEVGAQDGKVRTSGEVLERCCGGVPVAVAHPGRDDRCSRAGGIEQRRRGGRVGAVVADLQHVDRPEHAARDEGGLDRFLGISGQEGREPAVPEHRDHRAVVDVAVGEWRQRIGLGGGEDLEGREPAQRQALSCSRDDDRDAGGRRVGEKAVVGRVLERDGGVDEDADAEPVEDVDEPGHVVLVGMTEEENVDATAVERQIRPEPSQRALRVGAAVDEHGGAVR
jgi:hypothetical protein